MRSVAKSLRVTQLNLFQPPIQSPDWEQLPVEMRQQTVCLLAQLLREHAARESTPTGGGCDE